MSGRFRLNFSTQVMLASFLVLAYFIPPATAFKLTRSKIQYHHFFPAWEGLLKGYLDRQCYAQWSNYQNTTYPDNGVSYNVLDCLLDQFPEFRKAELAASAVVLGLAPTILQTFSPSAADTALLATRRPILAFLISATTVTVRASTAKEFSEVVERLEKPLPNLVNSRFPFSFLKSHQKWWIAALVSIAQYSIVCAALANTAYRTYQLCVWALVVFVPQNDYLPAIWAASALPIHLLGWLAMILAFRHPISGYRNPVREIIKAEITPSAWAGSFSLERHDDGRGYMFYVVNSLLYIGVPLQILYGSMILASLVFLSVLDAVVVVAWFTLSTIACNAILMYEFAGMRQVVAKTSTP